MGRVKYNMNECVIRERKVGEVGQNIRINNDLALSVFNRAIGSQMPLAPFINEKSDRVRAVKPEHSGAAAGIKNQL